tara:strand:- start:15 stop:491 length:477 start_codon:yes stop_codon:yes gene_type:complete
MKTNRSPLNQQDQDSHEFDHKPAKSDIKMAKIINAKMKKLKDKSFDHQFNKNEKLDEVVVKAPKNYSQIKNRDGSQLMTANEAKITDETGFKPESVKDKEFRGGPSRKSALNMLGIKSPLNFKGANSSNSSCWKGYKKVGTKKSPSGTGETVNDCEKI